MKKKFYIKRFLLLIGILSCSSGPDYDPNEIPVTPYGIKIKAEPGNTFTISYYIQNEEDTFDGYNLYITRESTIGTTEILKSTTQPYSLNGSTPTLMHSSTSINLNLPETITISNFLISQKNVDGTIANIFVPFDTGVRYYFKITSHTFFDKESVNFSNEVSAVAVP